MIEEVSLVATIPPNAHLKRRKHVPRPKDPARPPAPRTSHGMAPGDHGDGTHVGFRAVIARTAVPGRVRVSRG